MTSRHTRAHWGRCKFHHDANRVVRRFFYLRIPSSLISIFSLSRSGFGPGEVATSTPSLLVVLYGTWFPFPRFQISCYLFKLNPAPPSTSTLSCPLLPLESALCLRQIIVSLFLDSIWRQRSRQRGNMSRRHAMHAAKAKSR